MFTTRMCNGIQPGHENYATMIYNDTDEGRLVVDFSSVPNARQILVDTPTAKLCSGNHEEQIGLIVTDLIFTASAPNLVADQVLRIDFKIDWKAVEKAYA